MKLLYIFTSPSLQGSSVQTKVLSQIRGLAQAGIECRGAFFSTEISEQEALNDAVDLIPVAPSGWRYFQSSGKKRKMMQAVLHYTRRHHPDYDFILFRYPGAGSYLRQFTRLYGVKTIFEHLSIEVQEIHLQASDNPLGCSVSALLSHLEYAKLPLWREALFGASVRRNARLGLCNSEDIAVWQKRVAAGRYRTLLSGDAVNTNDFSLHLAPAWNNLLNMVFLKGASTSATYNGLERILKGMQHYKGAKQIHLHILGRQLDYERSLLSLFPGLSGQVHFHGFLSGSDLDSFMNSMHIGVSQFGIHKKGLRSNSTIKSREYFARGLPFIFGHHDPDLSGQPGAQPYLLEFPPDDSPVDMEAVIGWYEKLAKRPETAVEMRNFAAARLDYSVKMKKLAAFLQQDL